MSNQLSIISKDPKDALAALQKSRLSALIADKALFGRICEAAVSLLNNDKLRACDESSILGALYKAVTLECRLEPEFGECYLIPRTIAGKPVCCFQLGYKFWRAQALESGAVSYLQAREVYTEDEFAYQYGTGGFIRHIPSDENKGGMTHFYAHARLKDGSELFEVITKQAAEKSRKNSESQYDWVGSPGQKKKVYSEQPKDIWAKNYAPMALRVPIKRLCAALPLTAQIESAMQADGSISYMQENGEVVTISPVDVEKQADQPQDEPAFDEKQAELFQDVTDALTNMDFDQTLKYWNDFKTTPNGKIKPFATLFTQAGCQYANSLAHLSALWTAMGAWTNTAEIKQIFSTRRQAIEAAEKNG